MGTVIAGGPVAVGPAAAPAVSQVQTKAGYSNGIAQLSVVFDGGTFHFKKFPAAVVGLNGNGAMVDVHENRLIPPDKSAV